MEKDVRELLLSKHGKLKSRRVRFAYMILFYPALLVWGKMISLWFPGESASPPELENETAINFIVNFPKLCQKEQKSWQVCILIKGPK